MWIAKLENNWRIRVNGQDITGRLDTDVVIGPHRWNDPVEVELTDAQAGPFRRMIAGLEGTGRVSVGRVQGRWA